MGIVGYVKMSQNIRARSSAAVWNLSDMSVTGAYLNSSGAWHGISSSFLEGLETFVKQELGNLLHAFEDGEHP